jgi:hypothetical protein
MSAGTATRNHHSSVEQGINTASDLTSEDTICGSGNLKAGKKRLRADSPDTVSEDGEDMCAGKRKTCRLSYETCVSKKPESGFKQALA